jgi:hypothetical protein
MVGEPDATLQPTLQDNQLMSKHRVLSFKPQLRLEWRGQDGQSETEQPDHSASLGDSIMSSTHIRFSVHTGGANTPDIERTSPASPVRRRAAELGGFNSPAFSRLPALHGILGNRNKLFEQGAPTHSSDERARLSPPVQTASLATFRGGVLTDLLAGLAANSKGLAKSFFRTREFRRDGLSYPLQAHSICPDEVIPV